MDAYDPAANLTAVHLPVSISYSSLDDSRHGEVKSMRTAKTHLRPGVASVLLRHIMKDELAIGRAVVDERRAGDNVVRHRRKQARAKRSQRLGKAPLGQTIPFEGASLDSLVQPRLAEGKLGLRPSDCGQRHSGE
jgi:hypothetical protein